MFSSHIRRQIRLTAGGDGGPPLQYLEPAGDPGLFGPDSQAWVVHADFVSMMIGGIGALVVQALHPLALAGVWDHSNFRKDLRGRLARTAQFIAATTYGGTAMAEQALARVRAIHQQVQGESLDGRRYRADDPQLLYWVHLAETTSFLGAHRQFVDPAMPQARSDRYFAEMALIPRSLGCVPEALRSGRIASTEQQARADMLALLDQLEYSERARFVVGMLEDRPLRGALGPMQDLLVQAALANLPDWAYPLMRRPRPGPLRRHALHAGVQALALPIRHALRDGIAAHARRRMRA